MLSIEQRYNICLISEKYPNWTQTQLAQWAYETLHLSKVPSQGAISRMLAKKEVYMNSKEHEKSAIRIRNPINVLVRRVLQEWISQSCWNGLPITLPILQETAKSIWNKLPDEHREGDGSFSAKWIINCISRMGLDINILCDGKLKTPKVWNFEERHELKKMLIDKELNSNNIFTVDETLLAYDLPLDYSQYDKLDGNSTDIDVATVMLCSNLDGSEKLNPLVVGKYDSYTSFRNYFPDQPTDRISEALLGQKMALRFDLSYHSNRKASLTSSLFHDWLVSWDKRLVANNRKIVIILDDSSSHRVVNLKLKNIELFFASSNSKFLPFNWGVMDEFKTRYRIKQYQALIELQSKIINQNNLNNNTDEDNGNMNDDNILQKLMSPAQSKLTMSNAFKFIRESWNEIDCDAIKSSWRSSGLIPSDINIKIEDRATTYKKNINLSNEIEFLCNKYQCERKWDHDLLLNLNIESKTSTFLSIEELVDCSIIEKTEINPVGVVPQNTPTNFSYSPNAQVTTSNMNNTLSINNTGDNNSLSPTAVEKAYKVTKGYNRQNKTTYDKPNTYSSNLTTNRGTFNQTTQNSNYAVDLDALLNPNTYSFLKGNNINISNFIDRPTMFTDNNIDDMIIPNDIENDKISDYLNDIIESKFQISTPESANTNVESTSVNNLASDEGKIFPIFGIPDSGRIPPQIPEQKPYIPPKEIPQLNFGWEQDDESISKNSLLTNIDIAKSLGSILKNVLANELSLSPSTMFELKSRYESVLKVVKSNSTSTNLKVNDEAKTGSHVYNPNPPNQAEVSSKGRTGNSNQPTFNQEPDTSNPSINFGF
ncbi:hypothetical protein TPHA_0A02040 [Tetrapisispora phaffii CBS 4417]|uniref:HTH CENPB-type domain-containing protein n=1 Tax=Tetrapisispora phaffii (strain ATCC 24235 / CBS 4417 / NBRC 1672 / NRRL Y-8282 / UCD 70-5) TaxID=1071381 RepID=G8BN08_TETPH|nr:hypothetical protein TPHA_0A02040 [Tetrapisispora phaffii CBS 4417]CCE61286.1 hypothetical protein TPHA_0A02040 [Tetrapisispora phaffii CBS 4417]